MYWAWPALKPPEKREPKVRKSSFLGFVKGALKVGEGKCDAAAPDATCPNWIVLGVVKSLNHSVKELVPLLVSVLQQFDLAFLRYVLRSFLNGGCCSFSL